MKSSGIKKAARPKKSTKEKKVAKQKILAKVTEKIPKKQTIYGQFTRSRRFAQNHLNNELIPQYSDKIQPEQIRYSKEAIQLIRMFNQELLLNEFRKHAILNRVQNKQTVSIVDVHAKEWQRKLLGFFEFVFGELPPTEMIVKFKTFQQEFEMPHENFTQDNITFQLLQSESTNMGE